MTHRLTTRLPQAELRKLLESKEAQDFLGANAKKTKREPFIYHWVSNDDPSQDLAVAVMFPGFDVIWIGLLVIGDIQYIPEVLNP